MRLQTFFLQTFFQYRTQWSSTFTCFLILEELIFKETPKLPVELPSTIIDVSIKVTIIMG